MLWEDLSVLEFEKAVKESGVCILPIGVLEKHGNHLPLGTDMITCREICKAAAQKEGAVVFPYYYLGQIAEGRHFAGTISVSNKLMMESLLAMCDEISRNGFKKIIILSGHGGNGHFLPFFAQEMPRLDRDYCVYTAFSWALSSTQREEIAKVTGGENLGAHAGLSETSLIMHLRPELVNMETQDSKESVALGKLSDISKHGLFNGFHWYANYPEHFAGDHKNSTPQLGKMIFDMAVGNVVEMIKAVKADDVSPQFVKEYAEYGKDTTKTPKYY